MKWSGREWVPLEYSYPTGDLYPSQVLDDGTGAKLFAGRNIQNIVTFFKWDGTSWEMMPAAFFDYWQPTTFLTSYDDGNGSRIYGCRERTNPNQRNVIRWDGASWTVVGTPAVPLADITAAAVYDDGSGPALYVGGGFTAMNGVQCRRIARWNGQVWSPVGAGLTNGPVRMVVLDVGTGPKLYTLGGLLGPNGENLICVWDGHSWSNIGGASAPVGVVFDMEAMAVYDDGTGPGLAIGGNMPYVAGVEVHGAARWNGQTWSALGAGIRTPTQGHFFRDFVACPDAKGPSLFAIGAYIGYGGGTVGDIAQWVGCPNCYANCDLSTVAPKLNIRDFICFINKFTEGDPYANCTVDATIDISDFVCFLNKFATGCP